MTDDSTNRLAPPATLYRHTVGSGPDVVLLHGWGMHSGVWDGVAESLRDDYRVTVLDLPGHGYSRRTEAGHTLADLCAAVIAVTPPQATWVGWSLGGLVAQQVAITAPERVNRLALVSATPCFMQRPDWPHGVAPSVLRHFAEDLRQNYRATLHRFIALEIHGSEHAAAQLRLLKAMLFQHGEPDVAALEGGLAILEHADLRAELPRIVCPILLLMGQRDQLVPATAGAAIQQGLPNARMRVFPHAGHAPFFSHLPEFLAELRVFLDA
ncbi:MAG: pimeloyl-ACP methyl ester esterase BioH [Candidatus Competibacter sp.]|nr:pimeloyl-ACP methyl ester esterase BioH [Candidatus Competibacter sp.]MDG4607042.1 pimeloyl-ACP methyl ester esterase BioH [Candidatus Contendobacter sp.]HRD48841.1 pimeloyl-ACP methyl ester esterase BioH [Candidatus Contendobacter sp.]